MTTRSCSRLRCHSDAYLRVAELSAAYYEALDASAVAIRLLERGGPAARKRTQLIATILATRAELARERWARELEAYEAGGAP